MGGKPPSDLGCNASPFPRPPQNKTKKLFEDSRNCRWSLGGKRGIARPRPHDKGHHRSSYSAPSCCLRFQRAGSSQVRATPPHKRQQSLSSFSRPNTLDLRLFSSPCILCARRLLSRTSHSMARSWSALALHAAWGRGGAEDMMRAQASREQPADQHPALSRVAWGTQGQCSPQPVRGPAKRKT